MDTHQPIIERATLVLNADVDMPLCKRVTHMKFKILEVAPKLVIEKEYVSYNDILSIAKLLQNRFQPSDNMRSVVLDRGDWSDERSVISDRGDWSDERSVISDKGDLSDGRSVISDRQDTSPQLSLQSLAGAQLFNSDMDNQSTPSFDTHDLNDITPFMGKSSDEIGIHKNRNRVSSNILQEKALQTLTGHDKNLVNDNKQQSLTVVASDSGSLHDNTHICPSQKHLTDPNSYPGNNPKTDNNFEKLVGAGTSNTKCFSDTDNGPEEQRILTLNPVTDMVVSEGVSHEVDGDRDTKPSGSDVFLSINEKRQDSLDTNSEIKRRKMKNSEPGAGSFKGFGYSEEQSPQTQKVSTINSTNPHYSESNETLLVEQKRDQALVSDNTPEGDNEGETTKATICTEFVESYNALSDKEETKSTALAGTKEKETNAKDILSANQLDENTDRDDKRSNAICTVVKDNKDNIHDNKTITLSEANHVENELNIEGKTFQQNAKERLPDSDDDSPNDSDSTDFEEKTIVLKRDDFNAARYYFKNTEFSSRLTSQSVDLNLKEKTDAKLAEHLARFKVVRIPVTGLSQGDLEEMLEEFVKSPSDKVKVKVFVNDVVLMGPSEKVLEAKRKLVSKCERQYKTSQDLMTRDSKEIGASYLQPSATRLVKHTADDKPFFSLDSSNRAVHGSHQSERFDSLQQLHVLGIEGYSLSHVNSSHSFRDQPRVYKGHRNHSLTVSVANADITQMSVDVVVSAANTKLKHHGGVAKAIAVAAGRDMTQECDSFIDKHGPLDVTDVFVSGAGTLQAVKVMHAVAPVYKLYVDKDKCVTDLRQTVVRCVVEASRLGMSSIALPSVSAVVFKTHEEKCAQCYMEAMKHYDDFIHELNLQPVREVYFVDVDTNMVNTTQEYFLKHWDQPPDRRLVQMDLEFSRKHLKEVLKSVKVTSQGANGFKDTDYTIGNNINLGVRTGPALSLGSEMTVVFGDVFDALTNRPGFKVKEQVKGTKTLPKVKDCLKFVKLNKPDRSEMYTLCVVSPQPQSLRDIDTCFKNLKLATPHFNSAGIRSLTFTSKLLYPEKAKIKQPLLESFARLVVGFVKEVDLDHDSSLRTVMVAANEMTCIILTKVFDSQRIERKLDKGPQNYLQQEQRYEAGNWLSATFPENLGSVPEGACGGHSPPRSSYFSSLYDHVTRLLAPSISEADGGDQGTAEIIITPARNCKKNVNNKQGKELKDSGGLDNACVICYEKNTSVILPCCKARICSSCKTKVQLCPFCRQSLETLTGSQPDGTMDVDLSPGNDYWKITYHFPAGIQKGHHPHPGKIYPGTTRTAYIPSTEEGYNTLLLLRLAFKRRLIFTIGKSLTMNIDDMITWNDIHHKTSLNAGTYGFPDPTYIERVNQELSAKGVTSDSMSKAERRDIETFSKTLKTERSLSDND